MAIALMYTRLLPAMHLENMVDVNFARQLDAIPFLVYVKPIVLHANALIAWCANALAASGGMLIDDGNQLLSSGGVLGGNCKVINLMANKNELTVDLALV